MPEQDANPLPATDPWSNLGEILHLFEEIDPETDTEAMRLAYADVVRLFRGEYPGYRACTTAYHDLDHTLAVSLASARLAHGAFVSGRPFPARDLLLLHMAAIFHDVGYIQRDDDTEGSGAKYTVGHEERGIQFLSDYLGRRGARGRDIRDCAGMIRCTNLSVSPSDLSFSTPGRETLGKMLGAADLLAQVADRWYLEKLFYLYREFHEAEVEGFESELDLLRKTQGFYEHVARRRMDEELDGVDRYMLPHFRARWDLEVDPYQDSIRRNLEYLQTVLATWRDRAAEKLNPENGG
ncbi:HD domain-containing protein [Desulfohalovibrio reitneri]|uniref:HD domain-containing protein n=1 Tax=Desulfohalovibrio reitneri TaxID=1307759 RepID=UPI00068B216E|nr:HD domain-containing protein [Desulfohalovibrio reitneri]